MTNQVPMHDLAITTKLGTNKGVPASRIWIEGDRLTRAGFHRGSTFTRQMSGNELILMLATPDDTDARLYKVSGKGSVSAGWRPIIDITGAIVLDNFTGTHVVADFWDGMISISGAE